MVVAQVKDEDWDRLLGGNWMFILRAATVLTKMGCVWFKLVGPETWLKACGLAHEHALTNNECHHELGQEEFPCL